MENIYTVWQIQRRQFQPFLKSKMNGDAHLQFIFTKIFILPGPLFERMG